MTELEQIRLWEKEEAAKRMRLLGKCRCLDCKNWNLNSGSSFKCIFLDFSNIKETRQFLINTPGHWRKCKKYETINKTTE